MLRCTGCSGEHKLKQSETKLSGDSDITISDKSSLLSMVRVQKKVAKVGGNEEVSLGDHFWKKVVPNPRNCINF